MRTGSAAIGRRERGDMRTGRAVAAAIISIIAVPLGVWAALVAGLTLVQQVLAGFAQRRDIGALLLGQAGALQQSGHAKHAVQRRAELVTQRSELLGADAGLLVRIVVHRPRT